MGSQHPAETRETDDDEAVFCCGLDADIHKVFRIRERHTFQFRLEAFNARNHPNWRMPNLNFLLGVARPRFASTAAHANFGVVTSTAGAMRQLHLGLKYSL
jgi:hypothetical protein